jgi:DNA invertase Pin-like site-specific DNA recombinase
MLVGYARVSTQDQHLALQIDALHKAGCERIFEDKISGSKTDRVGLANAISHLRKDDTLVVWKLDRLGRSVKDLVRLITQLEGQGVHFKSLTDVIDTSTPSGRFFFHVMASHYLIANTRKAASLSILRLTTITNEGTVIRTI